MPRGLLTLCPWASSGLYTAYMQPIFSRHAADMQPTYSLHTALRSPLDCLLPRAAKGVAVHASWLAAGGSRAPASAHFENALFRDAPKPPPWALGCGKQGFGVWQARVPPGLAQGLPGRGPRAVHGALAAGLCVNAAEPRARGSPEFLEPRGARAAWLPITLTLWGCSALSHSHTPMHLTCLHAAASSASAVSLGGWWHANCSPQPRPSSWPAQLTFAVAYLSLNRSSYPPCPPLRLCLGAARLRGTSAAATAGATKQTEAQVIKVTKAAPDSSSAIKDLARLMDSAVADSLPSPDDSR